MTYEEMGFTLFRDNSRGYRAMYRDGRPVGSGKEIDHALFDDDIEEENRLMGIVDDLFGGDTPLYRAADGLLYKVCSRYEGGVRIWIRAGLLPDRAERLREFRKGKGPLRELEEKTGIKSQNISKFENGDRDIVSASGKVLLKLADALGVTVEELIR